MNSKLSSSVISSCASMIRSLSLSLSLSLCVGVGVCVFTPAVVSSLLYCMLPIVEAVNVQMIMLEGAKATTETVDALRTGASAMKAMQKAT